MTCVTALSRWSLLVALRIALILAAPTSALDAQQDSARLVGTVRSSINGRPLGGVMIAVGGSRVFDVSDSAGAFKLSGLPSGQQTVRILYRDEVFSEHPVKLKRGRTVQLYVLLDLEAVELAPVVVEARSVRALRSLAGFYERRKRGFGRFYTFEDLERRGALRLDALLTESGVQVRCSFGTCVPLIQRGARLCVPALSLDGMPAATDDLAFLRADDLAGVEIYKSAIDVPWEFQRSVAGNCGAIVLWSRY